MANDNVESKYQLSETHITFYTNKFVGSVNKIYFSLVGFILYILKSESIE